MNHTIYPTTSWTDQILEQGEKAGGSLSNYIHALVKSRFSGQSDDLVGSRALPAAGHVEPQPMPGTARRLEVRRYRKKVSDFRLYLVRSSTV
ncbi:MAG: hypothetical protein P1V20_01385 [Verrucomicrobiales bacterium]|nr:hypothetical protein [Verrucomicrobiales bacterium]